MKSRVGQKQVTQTVTPSCNTMRMLIYTVLILLSLLILAWGVMMTFAGAPDLVFAVGLVTVMCAVVNLLILARLVSGKGPSGRTSRNWSLGVNAILFLTWLVTSLDSGGLHQFEGPVVAFLAAFGVANWYVLHRESCKSRSVLGV